MKHLLALLLLFIGFSGLFAIEASCPKLYVGHEIIIDIDVGLEDQSIESCTVYSQKELSNTSIETTTTEFSKVVSLNTNGTFSTCNVTRKTEVVRLFELTVLNNNTRLKAITNTFLKKSGMEVIRCSRVYNIKTKSNSRFLKLDGTDI